MPQERCIALLATDGKSQASVEYVNGKPKRLMLSLLLLSMLRILTPPKMRDDIINQ
jgi:hypothetical protein